MYRRPLEVWRGAAAAVDAGGGRGTSTQERVLGDPDNLLLGKVDQPAALEQYEAAQAGVSLTHVVYFGGVVDVRRGDELRDPEDAELVEKFRVESVVRPSTPRYTRCNVERIQVEGE